MPAAVRKPKAPAGPSTEEFFRGNNHETSANLGCLVARRQHLVAGRLWRPRRTDQRRHHRLCRRAAVGLSGQRRPDRAGRRAFGRRPDQPRRWAAGLPRRRRRSRRRIRFGRGGRHCQPDPGPARPGPAGAGRDRPSQQRADPGRHGNLPESLAGGHHTHGQRGELDPEGLRQLFPGERQRRHPGPGRCRVPGQHPGRPARGRHLQ